jgi:hypothetical protein
MSAHLTNIDMLLKALPAGYGTVVSAINEETRTVTFKKGYKRGQDMLIAKIVWGMGWHISFPMMELFPRGI